MRTLVTILTATMLLVHAQVGCCRHHEHSARDEAKVACHSLDTCCCQHNHHCHSRPVERPASPCKCKLECKSLCNYLPPQRCLLDATPMVSSIDMAPVVSDSAINHAAIGRTFWIRGMSHHAFEPPLRLHLLHQIILI